MEAVNGKIGLREHLLRDVFGIVVIAQDTVNNRENLGLIALHEVSEGDLIVSLEPPDKGLITRCGIRATLASGSSHHRRKLSYFAQVAHAHPSLARGLPLASNC